MARYQCLICGEDKTFTQYAHCERHLTAAHSGFGFKCDHCGALLGRVDQTHKNCGEYHLDLIKRSTMTCTPEERKEFEEFQNNRYKHIKQIMKGLPIPMSDQPFGTINRPSQAKKTKLVEAHTERPKKKAKRVETISKAPEATLTERREEEGRKENREDGNEETGGGKGGESTSERTIVQCYVAGYTKIVRVIVTLTVVAVVVKAVTQTQTQNLSPMKKTCRLLGIVRK